ncbi:N-acetylglucosamine transferase [Cereibacter changlensis JA139]|uniref:NADPH--hemoprotein reductase n=2 Tax=Cereibacter changlensis TaxID=402884 RepID=A0A2T4JNB8_9RHOB|nr:PepSY domain-containing protein [Cereibacter changlensis]PTE19404.1 N-acetylglucosamine transferase [Cereibacter changlensis JA139]PZX47542.1 sulfite reductase (NADPH) flavoprotein alpha-component [Cereibacter changlensis]
MIRRLHKLPGLAAALLLMVMSLSGVVLSVLPAVEAARMPAAAEVGLAVADLVDRVTFHHPGVEQIRRSTSGRITAWFYENGRPGAATVDPATGADSGSADRPAPERWLTNLHRSLFLGDAGRIAVAVAAGALSVIALSGLLLTVRRIGGWRRYLAPLRGPLTARLHLEVARIISPALILLSVTGLWMTAATFDLLPQDGVTRPPEAVSGQTGYALSDMPLLRETPVVSLRVLTFPYPDDASDVVTLETARGEIWLDQGTGEVVGQSDRGPWERVTETIYWLHTAEGSPALGLLLGFMALGVPILSTTGVLMWLEARMRRPRIKGSVAARQADTILLVGSEAGSTWGFAATLQIALTAAGRSVHVGAMSGFDLDLYRRATELILLTATYGDGAAPASASAFLSRFVTASAPERLRLAVLGFGDRQFPSFCGYAEQVAQAAEAGGWRTLLPLDRIDRQSSQDFSRWGRALGLTLGIELDLNHQPVAPKAVQLTLMSRRDYGEEVGAPTAILRFGLPPAGFADRLLQRGFASFEAGDLIGVLPEGSAVPRLYSLASASRDGFAEICVRRHPGGLCSSQLTDLSPGDRITAFLRPNPAFRPAPGRSPVILIGAGTGIGPLAGFARANRRGRAMHLYFGARHAESDLLYGEDMAVWQADDRLTSVTTAYSRMVPRLHVQDALRRDAARIVALITEGAQIMVCGGRDMAAGVNAALTDILAPAGLSPALLKAEGRYAEDVY